MRRTPKHMLDFKSMLKAYHCLQSDCVKSSSKLPRAGMVYCTGSQSTQMGGLKHAHDLHVCLNDMPDWGHSTEYLNVAGS